MGLGSFFGTAISHVSNFLGRTANAFGKGTASFRNMIDNVAASIQNTRLKFSQDFAEAFNANKVDLDGVKAAYRNKRNQSATVQREIEEGLRNADGTRIRPERPIKEARKPQNGSSPAAEAINNPKTGYVYRQRVVDGQEIFERKPMGAPDTEFQSINMKDYADAKRSVHAKTSEFNVELDLPSVIDKECSFWDGIPQWAKYGGIAVAGGIAGAVIFGGDDDDD